MARRTADDNRAAIASAARELFATLGYDRATIRAIGERSGVDPAMVMRYFGSKEKLFASVVDLDLGFADVGVPPAVEEVGSFIVRHAVRLWERHEAPLIFLRTAIDHEPARVRVRALAIDQVQQFILLVGAPPEEARLRASLVASQVLGLVLARLVARIEPLASADVDDLVRWYGPTLQRYVIGELHDREADTRRPFDLV